MASLAIAAAAVPLAFSVCWVLLCLCLGLALALGGGSMNSALFQICLCVAILAALTTSRAVYMGLRWRCVVFDGRHCTNCEYDLTGNVSGACPECGREVPEI